jgi:hypothetical protein
MELQISKNIDLSYPEQYVLVIEVHAEYFSFFIYNPDNPPERCFFRFNVDEPSCILSQFQELFFDHDFFSYPFRKTLILNRTPVFTYIPNALFEEKNKEAYLQFLFVNVEGIILHQTLFRPEITILHTMPNELHNFLQRSFPEASIVHYTAATIAWSQGKGLLTNGNRMVIYCRPNGIDVLCFSRQQLLLANHFRLQTRDDAVYYVLYIYKQLKFSQLKDCIYITGEDETMLQALKKYVKNVISIKEEDIGYDELANMKEAPFDITSIAQFYE